MFRNILVGVDGRQGGRDAIALARRLSTPETAFTLAHVYSMPPGRGGGLALPYERADSEQLLEGERRLADLDAQLVISGQSSVGRGLHELAEAKQADLLVVGSTRHALLGRVLMGDDCRAAVDGAPCAIAVAPRGYAQVAHELHRLGVGYDGTPEGEHALSVARELAAPDGTIRAMWVVSLPAVQAEKPIPADWPEEIDALIELHTERLAGVEGVHGVVCYGGPREELAQFSQALDLLVVGSRPYGPLGRVFHSSVSRYLVRHASCPLLVLPRSVYGTQSSRSTESASVGSAASSAGDSLGPASKAEPSMP